jgi:hypothetical protein
MSFTLPRERRFDAWACLQSCVYWKRQIILSLLYLLVLVFLMWVSDGILKAVKFDINSKSVAKFSKWLFQCLNLRTMMMILNILWILLKKVTSIDRFQDLIPEGKQRIRYKTRFYNFTLAISLSRLVTKR